MSTAAADKKFVFGRKNTDISPLDSLNSGASKNRTGSLEIEYMGGEGSVVGTPSGTAPFKYACYDFIGGTVPNNTDYPDTVAPVGSKFCRLVVVSEVVVGAEEYLKTAAGIWSLTSPQAILAADKIAAYTVNNADRVVKVDTQAGAVTITLAPVAEFPVGVPLTFIRTGTGTNAITLDGDGTEEIDGATTYAAMDAIYDSVTIMNTGTEYVIVASKLA